VKTARFESLSLDSALDLLQSKVATLSRRNLAALFGSIGRAMLPIYLCFSQRNQWGDATILQSALDAVFGYSRGQSDLGQTGESILHSITEITPHVEDFDCPDSIFAINAAICVDVAVRACVQRQEMNSSWVEYAVDPIVSTVCEQETGYVDLGSSQLGMAWRAQAMKNPMLRGAFEAIAEMVDLLSELRSPGNLEHLETLAQLAHKVVPPQ
jgi:uncharacterized protein YjaG (DUF416 family)